MFCHNYLRTFVGIATENLAETYPIFLYTRGQNPGLFRCY